MGTGPRQCLVPTWGLFGASLPRAPAHSPPSCNGKQPLLIPRATNPNHRVVHHVAPLPLSHSRPLTWIKQWVFIQSSLPIPALGAFFVATTSTVSKQRFPHPHSSIPSPWPQIHPKLSLLDATGSGEHCCRGWPCLNPTVVAEEPPKVPIPSLP